MEGEIGDGCGLRFGCSAVVQSSGLGEPELLGGKLVGTLGQGFLA